MDDLSRQWADQARYDLETADAMLKAGRYPEEIKAAGSAVTAELAREILGKTEQIVTWVLSTRE